MFPYTKAVSHMMKAFPKSNLAVGFTTSLRVARPRLHQHTRRGYASAASAHSNGRILVASLAAVGLGGASFYAYTHQVKQASDSTSTVTLFKPDQSDYQKVYDAIAQKLVEQDEYDDGSYGPVLVRLAWHASGTYDTKTKTGGSNGATMRFDPESGHGANAGLKSAREFLEPIKDQFPWISYSDLWTLGGVCAMQEMQGPTIPWRPGRADRDMSSCTPDGRLPDGAKGQDHLRDIFYRMGFDDREIVALSGAHALGRCHADRSGFEGPWTFSPTTMTNDYYQLLLQEKWAYREWKGPKQFQDASSKSLMMLPTDIALIKDKNFRRHVERFAKDSESFFKEFSDAFVKLLELGVPFPSGEDARMIFKSTA
ncbi:Cytochrome c peroxidase, mitochondrial [Sphaceloma murrayae]|uniref:Peroxidase n=1 Tax=Sphaceloma murrayae TaxID=2082308 RepID=A0A2K1QFW7_9PEZI|nr:Cytochrome c peroxidase, mitochondrial [Sphaceloma murrayae]